MHVRVPVFTRPLDSDAIPDSISTSLLVFRIKSKEHPEKYGRRTQHVGLLKHVQQQHLCK